MEKASAIHKLYFKSVRFIKRESPTILTCVGAVGVVATSIATAKAATKASKLLESAEEVKGEELTTLEKVNIAGPVYIPAVLFGAATITCIFGANVLNKRHQAAMASAYALLDRSYKEYKTKVNELYGEDANKLINEEIAKDKYEETDIRVTDGKQLFYDDYSKRYFESTMDDVIWAEYELNRSLVMQGGVYLNEWYESLDLEPLESYSTFGWSDGMCLDMYWQTWLDFSHATKVMDDGRECTVIYMLCEPVIDFEYY